MRLSAVIRDNKINRNLYVNLCEYKNKDGESIFIEEVTHPCGLNCFHVLVDEGYMKTNYYYPINRYSIVSLARW